MQRDHLYSCRCCFKAFITSFETGSVESLIKSFTGENAKGVRNACFLLRLPNAPRNFVIDGFVVRRFTAEKQAQRDDGVELARFGELAGRRWNLPRAGSAVNFDIAFAC